MKEIILTNKKNNPLKELCIMLATYMVALGLDISVLKARTMVINNLNNGKAYNKFLKLVKNQNGDISKLPKGTNKIDIEKRKGNKHGTFSDRGVAFQGEYHQRIFGIKL